MIIPDRIRKCVAYLGFETGSGEKKLCGTCFFVLDSVMHRGITSSSSSVAASSIRRIRQINLAPNAIFSMSSFVSGFAKRAGDGTKSNPPHSVPILPSSNLVVVITGISVETPSLIDCGSSGTLSASAPLSTNLTEYQSNLSVFS